MFLNNSAWFRRLASLAIVFSAIVVFCFNVKHYYVINFTEDDSFVSMVYARRLLAGQGLTWTDGVRVEGYSNFLWLVCQAGLAWLGMDLFQTSRVLGIFGMGLMFLGTILAFWPSREKSIVTLTFVLLALALCQPMAIWAVGGLEESFVVGFLSLGLFVVFRELNQEDVRKHRWLVAGLPLGLACLTRPDSPLLVAAISLGIVMVSGVSKNVITKIGWFILVPVICTVGLTAFRLWYFGEWLPNTALVKVPLGFGWQVKLGLNYFSEMESQQSLLFVSGLVLPALFVGGLAFRKRTVLLGTIVVVWSCYVIYVGGDCFRGLRFLLPVILLLAWMAGSGVEWLHGIVCERISASARFLLYGTTIAAFCVFFYLDQLQEENKQVVTAFHDSLGVKRQGLVLAENLKAAFATNGQKPYISSDKVGVVPWFTGWKTLCSLGLTDRWLPRHPSKNPVYRDVPGHQLGSGSYVLSKRPDLIHLGSFLGSHFGSVYQTGHELSQMPEFFQEYRFVEFSRLGGPTIRVWSRFESPTVGVIRSQNQIEVPAYLLDGQGTKRLFLDEGLWLPMPEGSSVTVRGLRLPVGEWSVRVKLRTDSNISEGEIKTGKGGPLFIVLAREQEVDLTIRATSDKTLGSLVLRRQNRSP
ncbi:MAG: hypothetical protein UX09_C0023G0011 [Candidatus Uhrbacteria bacterium GW2011_GWE2_45_35]|uniref:Glycosyltransferase RgtA/B/C/D-like domain-containing protein n=2 Tax=Candidatus Uhriibacteriota TaxID=1752732 RepID=A0A0G1JGX0_9BACT|nr:MAG: hypothetical protein UW63_C0023G0012 [Candidatus Uhrbacteria bacterium GW2011_GWF2_44_350]KKU07871.1 MAG: hypothetical protein UX09_C0023G0011 [Candidatus Uhrbacteria bacterium GW2011_GWE2_45_35]